MLLSTSAGVCLQWLSLETIRDDPDISLHRSKNDAYTCSSATILRNFFGAPSPPLNLRVDEIEERAIRVTWDAPETPNGPIDGYARRICWGEQHCDSSGATDCKMESDTYDKSAAHFTGLKPLMYYGVTLRAFNVVGKREKLYSPRTKLCVRFPPPPVKPLEEVKIECEKEPNRVSVSWDLPKENGSEVSDVYVVEIQGRKDGKADIDRTIMASKSSGCDDSTCSTTVYELKAEFEYSVSVRPHIEHIGPFGEGYIVKNCLLPPSAPPPATKEPFRIENDALNKTEAEFAFWKDMYSDMNGDVSYYEVLVAEENDSERCDQPTVWKDAHSKSPVPCYFATPALWMPFTSDDHSGESMPCASNATYAQCVVGADTKCGEDRCNGPLKENIKYAIRIRAYTAGGHTESAPLFVTTEKTTGKKNDGKRMSSEVYTVFIVGILPLTLAKVLLEGRCTVQCC
ncbi:receptor-type tyrosine-protein phosphatase dep-1-like isoform X2 [Ornithodoros turicata]|uniref:receptor-type tyrosine-protein phosphatase dep-1-like isoform X2 n=1 Tax=Ornithodoros turicata TaxID=34597 RepID=UPI003138B22C